MAGTKQIHHIMMEKEKEIRKREKKMREEEREKIRRESKKEEEEKGLHGREKREEEEEKRERRSKRINLQVDKVAVPSFALSV